MSSSSLFNDMVSSAHDLVEITTPPAALSSKNKTNQYDMVWIQLPLGRSQVTFKHPLSKL